MGGLHHPAIWSITSRTWSSAASARPSCRATRARSRVASADTAPFDARATGRCPPCATVSELLIESESTMRVSHQQHTGLVAPSWSVLLCQQCVQLATIAPPQHGIIVVRPTPPIILPRAFLHDARVSLACVHRHVFSLQPCLCGSIAAPSPATRRASSRRRPRRVAAPASRGQGVATTGGHRRRAPGTGPGARRAPALRGPPAPRRPAGPGWRVWSPTTDARTPPAAASRTLSSTARGTAGNVGAGLPPCASRGPR